jgi:hypothetical protein
MFCSLPNFSWIEQTGIAVPGRSNPAPFGVGGRGVIEHGGKPVAVDGKASEVANIVRLPCNDNAENRHSNVDILNSRFI